MAGSILEALSFQNFLAEEEPGAFGGSATEGRAGIPRFNGDPAEFNVSDARRT